MRIKDIHRMYNKELMRKNKEISRLNDTILTYYNIIKAKNNKITQLENIDIDKYIFNNIEITISTYNIPRIVLEDDLAITLNAKNKDDKYISYKYIINNNLLEIIENNKEEIVSHITRLMIDAILRRDNK